MSKKNGKKNDKSDKEPVEVDEDAGVTTPDPSASDEASSNESDESKPDSEIMEAWAPLREQAHKIASMFVFVMRTLEIILFGRFMANSNPKLKYFNAEGTVCVSHSISTNVFEPQDDYFTALDEITKKVEHIGSNSFGSSTMFKYWNLDLQELRKRLAIAAAAGDATNVPTVKQAVECFLDCVLDGEPTGRKNTFASFTANPIALVTVQEAPINLVSAFERPVSVTPGSELSLTEASARRLDREFNKIVGMYESDGRFAHRIQPVRIAVYGLDEENASVVMPNLSKHAKKTRDKFIDAITDKIDEALASGARSLFLNVNMLRLLPPSCTNLDDAKEHKRAVFGGFLRMRCSSQSEKRPVRNLMQDRYTNYGKGIRTKVLVSEIMTRLGIETTNRPMRAMVEFYVEGVGLKVSMTDWLDPESQGGETDALVFYGSSDIESMVSDLRRAQNSLQPLVLECWKNVQSLVEKRKAEVETKKGKKAEKTKAAKS